MFGGNLGKRKWRIIMPLTRISLRRGKPAAYRKAILDGIYLAMRETFNVPENDRFMVVTEHDADNFDYGKSYLGIARSDDLLLIQITVSNTRGIEQKRALVRDITDAVVRHFNVKPEAVMVQIMESPKDLKAKGGFLFSDGPPG